MATVAVAVELMLDREGGGIGRERRMEVPGRSCNPDRLGAGTPPIRGACRSARQCRRDLAGCCGDRRRRLASARPMCLQRRCRRQGRRCTVPARGDGYLMVAVVARRVAWTGWTWRWNSCNRYWLMVGAVTAGSWTVDSLLGAHLLRTHESLGLNTARGRALLPRCLEMADVPCNPHVR